MRDIILSKLREIEETQRCKILYAVESGSRAWGIASPDSDYDVRFVYVRRSEDYLRLDSVRDVIEWQLDDTHDINGWDITKTLRLSHKSNPGVFEWRASPIVYLKDERWDSISELIGRHFDKKLCATHYMSMARSNVATYLTGDAVKLKKYLYVIRPILCCRYILDKSAPPPMLLDTLAGEYLTGEVRAALDGLLLKKSVTSELGECSHIPALDSFIESELHSLDEQVSALSKSAPMPWDEMNSAFVRLLSDLEGTPAMLAFGKRDISP